MKREEIYQKLFEWEFCEPSEKIAKERDFTDALNKFCEDTGKPLYVIKPAILKTYPRYRSERLRNELPTIPPDVRRA